MARCVWGLLVFAVVISGAREVHADSPKAVLSGELAVASTYLWRGVNYHDDRFEPAFQPSAQIAVSSIGPGTLTGGVWLSAPVQEQTSTTTEIDPFLRYDASFADFAVGVLYWTFLVPDADPVDTGHLFDIEASYAGWTGLTPSLGISVDPIRANSVYYFARLAAERTLGTFTLSASLRGAVQHAEEQDFGLQDVTFISGVAYAPIDAWYVSITGWLAYGPRMPSGKRIIPVVVVATGVSR